MSKGPIGSTRRPVSRPTIARVVTVVVSVLALAFWSSHIVDQPNVITGMILEFHAGNWLSISSEQVEPFPMALGGATKYEDHKSHPLTELSSIRSGMRATVWYRNVGERRLVVDKVRVLEDADAH
jgi:hypothetical protein